MAGLRKERAAMAQSAEIRDAVDSAMSRGNAVDAVCTGLLMACALDPSVAFGSTSIIVGGFGMSPRRLDGRVLQPGNQAKRPRGFRADEVIPPAAYVPAPRLFATVGTALTLAGRGTYAANAAPAVAACSSDARRGVIEAFGALGPALFQKRAIEAELRASVGPTAGGALCEADLTVAAPSFADLPLGEGDLFLPSEVGPSSFDDGQVEWIGARDVTGLMAFASFVRSSEGHLVEGLGLRIPRVAVPVLRGVQRVDPTTPIGSLPPLRVEMVEGQLAAMAGLQGPAAALSSWARAGVAQSAHDAVAAYPELTVARLDRQ
jgi:hypothetical protein